MNPISILGFEVTDLTIDPDSKAYIGSDFLINNHSIIYRKAKVTPKKVGLFVACWQRNSEGKTAPFSTNHNIDF